MTQQKKTVTIKILKCSDSMMWYRNQIGLIREGAIRTSDGWHVRATDGYSNIVRYSDAEEIEINTETNG